MSEAIEDKLEEMAGESEIAGVVDTVVEDTKASDADVSCNASEDGGDDASPEASEEAHEPTEEELAEQAAREQEAREAAEKAVRDAAEREERMEAEKAAANELASKAVHTIGTGAGFVTRAGVYYDVKAPHRVEVQYSDLEQQKAAAQAALEATEPKTETEDGNEADLAETTEAPVVAAEPGLEDEDVEEIEDGYVDEAEFARRVARLTESVTKQSLHREIFYKTLVFCQESRMLRDIEDKIATFSEFKHAAASQYHFIKVLEEAGGLTRFELDEEGEIVTPERKEGLTEDEIDDLVYDYAFMTTDVGMAVVEQHTPKARIIELLSLVPERKDAYIELMDFVSEDPKTYNEISQLFQGRDVLYRLDEHGEPQKMQPSVFVDKLEAAGGIEYRDGWVLTEEGRTFLDELRGDKN